MTTKNRMLFLLTLVFAAACGGQTTSATSTPAVNFSMLAQNGSTVSGTGQIVESAGSFTITLKLKGMVAGSSHVSHVHAGQCASPGGIAYALQSVVADAAGTATTVSTVPAGYAIPTSGWYVNVHHGPDFTEAEYAPSDSCGNLTAR
jgi:hypothetical protein